MPTPLERSRRLVESGLLAPAYALFALGRAGVVAPLRPDRALGVLHGWLRWDISLAFGYATWAAREPHRTAIIDDAGALTFAEVDARSTRLAGGLVDLGVLAGDTIGLLCRNHRGMIESMVACAKLGVHCALLNTGLSAGQLADVATAHDLRLVIADAEFDEQLHGLDDAVMRVTAWTEPETPGRGLTLAGLIATGDGAHLPFRPRRARTIVLTSGTTGTPKGAARPESGNLSAVNALFSRIPLRAGQSTALPAPMFHTWGLAGLQLSVALGSTLVLRRKFDPEVTLRDLAEHRCSMMFAAPVMLQRMLEVPAGQRRQFDLHRLEVIACSGSAPSPSLVSAVQDWLGPVLYNIYGSTEVSWVSIAAPPDLLAEPATAGRAPRGTTLAILDDNGRKVSTGRTGTIHVGNDMLFEGYLGGQDGPARTADGLMSTGDVGYLDADGLLFVTGRADDMIVSGGENVYPQAVEDALSELPGIADVAVVGVDDEEFGQRLAAYVVCRQGAALDEDSVRDHVRERLARFSVPRDVIFVESLPRNDTGKVLKRELPAAGSESGQ